MAYTDQATVEAYLNRSLSSNEQTILPLAIAAVDSFINEEVGSTFSNTSSTRYYDGGVRTLVIDSVRSITKVELVDTDDSNTVLNEYDLDEDYERQPVNETVKTYIESRIGAFPKGIANIAVTGKFSLTDSTPDDIKYLATYLTAKLFQKAVTGDLKSESIEGYSRTFAEFKAEDEVVQITLNKYTNDEVLL